MYGNHRCTSIHIKLIHNSICLVCERMPVLLNNIHYLTVFIPLFFSFVGITVTLITAFFFVKNRETPVAKASTRELCYVMLFGMILAHSIPIVIIWRPSLFICSYVKIMPAISFTIIYSALLVKTNRITRILSMSRDKFPTLNPRFISLKAQVRSIGNGFHFCKNILYHVPLSLPQLVMTSTLIAIGLVVCFVSLYWEPPIPQYQTLNHLPYVIILCPGKWKLVAAYFPYTGMLVLMCAIYAVKTRNLPGNFNQAKFIGFALYGSCMTWIAFSVMYFGDIFERVSGTYALLNENFIVWVNIHFEWDFS